MNLAENKPIIAVIGCGNMATALLQGMIGSQIDQDYHFNFSSQSIESAQELSKRFQSCTSTTDNCQAVTQAKHVLLAIKPQQAQQVCVTIAPHLLAESHIISVMAGITTNALFKWCGVTSITRVMPNTPALIGKGVAEIFHHEDVDATDREFARVMMENVGLLVTLQHEDQMHAITAISGGGPAYFFGFIHHLQQAAVELGFSEQQANELVQQTAIGAACLVQQSEDSALRLQQKVCSPNGTTEQAIKIFNHAEWGKIIKQAVNASYNRSIELAKPQSK